MYSIFKEEGRVLALLPSFIEMIGLSVNSSQYRRLFVRERRGHLTDVIGDGDLACAFYVSSILSLFNLIRGGVHTTVDMTVADIIDSGWYKVAKPHLGSILVWEKKLCTDGAQHRHIGFFIGNDEAISNDPVARSPQVHHYTYGKQDGCPVRRIETIYFHPFLVEK